MDASTFQHDQAVPWPLSPTQDPLLAAIAQSAQDAIICKTMGGTITGWNAGAERLYQYAPDEAVGRPVSIIVPCDRLSELGDILQAVAQGERVRRLTERLRKDGTRVQVAITVSPMRDAEGRIVGASTIERRIADEEPIPREWGEDSSETEAVGKDLGPGTPEASDPAAESEAQHSLLRSVLEHAPVGIAVLRGPDFVFEMVNPVYQSLAPGKTFVGKTMAETWPEYADQVVPILRRVLRTGEPFHSTDMLLPVQRTPSLRVEQALLTFSYLPMFRSIGAEDRILITVVETTEHRRTEVALREANEKLTGWIGELEGRNRESSLLSEVGDLLSTCATSEDAYEVVSCLMPKVFPESSGALYLLAAPAGLLETVSSWGHIPESERIFAVDGCWGLRRGRAHQVEDPAFGPLCRHIRESLPGAYLCLPMVAQGQTLGTLHLRFNTKSISEPVRRLSSAVAELIGRALANLQLRQTLQEQAVHDQLTGLFNRRYMEETLSREISRAVRHGKPLGVILLDVDHFKAFNDRFGHEAGDSVLSALGSFLRKHVRAEDIVCRFGGEELILLLPDANLADTVRKAQVLMDGIREMKVEYRRQILGPLTVSMGVAAFPAHGRTGSEVIRSADNALYRAKVSGRDQIVSATDALAGHLFP